MATKVCFKCNVEKPLDEFYKHPAMDDGHVGKCKECNKKDVRENRAKKLDHYREYDKGRFGTPSRTATRNASLRSFRAKNPEKNRAHAAVSRALRSGKLIKGPCEKCGAENVDAHHDDYSKPLDVRWLCRRHHLIEHGNYIEETA